MGRLIVQPGGCGEQNMYRMTLPLTATHYLDSTNQWDSVGIERRNDAVNHINTGDLDALLKTLDQKQIISK